MKKKKLNLENLKVSSFVTSLDSRKSQTVRGGGDPLDTNETGQGDCEITGFGADCIVTGLDGQCNIQQEDDTLVQCDVVTETCPG